MFTKLKKYDKFIKNPVKVKRSVRILNNFRNIKADVYTTNKIIKKIQGWGAFCTNRIAQKCLSVALILALAVGMMPGRQAQAVEPTVFTASTYANHWGRSDLRAYLNNATKTNGTLPIDTTIDGTNSANFPAKFSDAEFGVVQPFTYKTNVLDRNKNAVAVYKTTDRFWLPSGNYNSLHVTSWGGEDISANAQYNKSIAAYKACLIPISYWNYGRSTYSWLRSSDSNNDDRALRTYRGGYVHYSSVNILFASAAACKINLNSEICGSVIFASAASAANLAAAGGTQKIEIAGSENFGKKVKDALPDYGMYLKTASDKSFNANSLSLSGTSLSVNYTGGEAGQYVVVQAFNEDSLTAGTTGYAAAQQLEAGQTSATIDVTNWGISSLDGYTVKVWMEDGTGSLAKATIPETFVCINGVFVKTTDGAVQNGRVFAMKADLQCSWGTLANDSDLVGKGATNQKIIFGGMEFWIAGRETAANGGAISKDGDIMTLYQVKSVETRRFNESRDNYDVADKPAVTLQLAQDPISEIYDGTKKVYPEDQITTANLAEGYTLNWLHRMPGTNTWTEGMPTALGNYEVRCYTPGTENYERTYSNVVNFNIKKELHSSDLKCILQSLVYDGTAKKLTVTGPDGSGEITIVYFDKDNNQLSEEPINAGIYSAKANVTEGTRFDKAEGLKIIIFDTN